MKHILVLFAALFAALNEVDAQGIDATLSQDYLMYDFDNDGRKDHGEIVDVIEGDYDGDGTMERLMLCSYCDDRGDNGEVLEYEESLFYNVVISSNASHPVLSFELLAFAIINEGDLDGDGADEFGFFNCGLHGTWGEYCVYSLRGGKWRKVVSMSHSVAWDEDTPLDRWVRKDPNKRGHVIVRNISVEEGALKEISIPLI